MYPTGNIVYVPNMHVTRTTYMIVTLMLHGYTMSVYDMHVTVMVMFMSHECNMSVEVTCHGTVMLTCMVYSCRSYDMNVTYMYNIKPRNEN